SPAALVLGASLLIAASAAAPAGADSAAADAARASAPPVHERTILSPPYRIEKKYRSMLGPYAQQEVFLVESETPELLWITGYETEVVDAADGSEVSQEFMCHANLDFEPRQYMDTFRMRHGVSGRVFTLSQGQQRIAFPDGFGLPILSTQPFQLTTQVLNLNLEDPDLTVRHRVTIEFVRDREVPPERPMKPLYQAAVQGFKSLEDHGIHYGLGLDQADAEAHGPGCGVGMAAVTSAEEMDPLGQRFTSHWVVEPGREVNRSLVTRFLNLPWDTTAHYIAVHLHPFAESLELIDRTTGETVFRAEVDPADGKIGIDRVDFLASAEGIWLYKDHEYELVSVYENTSGEDQDSMAVMYMYLLDHGFRRPEAVEGGGAPATAVPE
ncbi:MAG TPA: hypothetical protein VLF66_00685, partial [Thermoanaerobaculia bacterium]|nr:hypothetical protein [Thermoanaerobaculia bacterium]